MGPDHTPKDTNNANGHECEKEISNESRRVGNEQEKKEARDDGK